MIRCLFCEDVDWTITSNCWVNTFPVINQAVNTWLLTISAAHTKLTTPLTEVLPGSPRGTIQEPIRRLYCWQLPEMTLAPPTNNRLFIGFTGIWRSLIYVVQSFFYIVLSVWRRRWVCLAPKEKDDVYADRSEYRRTEVCTSQVVIRWRSRYRRRRWSYFLLTFYYFLLFTGVIMVGPLY